jgi:hypothetical protein
MSPRKKAARKKAKRPTYVVKITKSLCKPDSRKLKMNRATGNPQSVAWKGTDRSYTVQFLSVWPFTGRKANIRVPKGKNSRTLTVSSTASVRSYDYKVVPGPDRSTEKPTPEVIVNG